MKLLIQTLIFIFTANGLQGQAVATSDDLVRAALLNHPLSKVAGYEVQAKKQAEKAALNLRNPELNAESPTGEFYTIGVLQTFDFPTVYRRQKQLAKAETELARAGQRLTENELRWTVRTLYLDAQSAEYQRRYWQQRDSLYQALATAAARQFTAGEIDFLQKSMAENEAGKIRQERLYAERAEQLARQQLRLFTGVQDIGAILPLLADTIGPVAESDVKNTNLSVFYEQQNYQVAEKQVNLAKSKAMPNFGLGYFNQGARNSLIDYRFRASVGIPLWAGQYRAGRAAAQSMAQAAQSRVAAQVQVVSAEMQSTLTESAAALTKLRYYEKEALPRSREMIQAATRMREAGQVDYIIFLRTLDEAFGTQKDYAEQVKALNAAKLRIKYLMGM
jgi:outer membrane protein TolC